jgi:hypothetical protein
MEKLLISLLPKRAQGYIEASAVLFRALDTQAERDAVLKYIAEMGKDGKVSVGEWSHLGKRLGILGRNHKPRRQKVRM